MMMISFFCSIIFLIIAMYLIAAVLISLKGQQSGMARIWLSELANDIRGSIKNHTYSIWKGLNYIREKAASIANPCSTHQSNIRTKTTQSSKRWYDTLTQGQRNLWNEYAEALTPKAGDGGGSRQVIPDNRGVMSGFNAYISINLWAYSAAITTLVTFIDDAPIGITPPNAPTALTCEWNDSTCCIGLTWVDPLDALVGTHIRVWMVSLDAGVHKQLDSAAGLAEESVQLCDARIALGNVANIRDLPGHYLVQIDAVGPNGQKGPPSNICEVIVPSGCTPA